jgi:hypothetical protein
MFITPAIIENIASRKDKTWKIIIGTNELAPEAFTEISKLVNNFCFVAFKVDEFKTEEKNILENLDTDFEDIKKSQSQRIRSVLYILFKQNNKGFETFDSFYRHKTETIIEHFKSKIE